MTDILHAALRYAEIGYSVIPVDGKKCPIAWARYQHTPAHYTQIHGWHMRGLLKGVGLSLGKVSKGLVVIDLDGLDAVSEFRATWPQLLETYTVLSGSGKGQHLYYYVRSYTDTTRTKGFELRSNGSYVVAPPSIHPDSGNPYQVINRVPVKRLDNMTDIQKWIRDKMPHKYVARAVDVPRYGLVSTKSERYVKAYALAALQNECNHVRGAAHGARNDSLFHAARRMGSLLASPDIQYHNALDRLQVETNLYAAAAALTASDGSTATQRTIQSGLAKGFLEPFVLPDPKPLRKRGA